MAKEKKFKGQHCISMFVDFDKETAGFFCSKSSSKTLSTLIVAGAEEDSVLRDAVLEAAAKLLNLKGGAES